MKSIYACFWFLFLFGTVQQSTAQGYCANDTVYLTEHHPVAFEDVVFKQGPGIDELFAQIPEDIGLRVYYPTDLPAGTKRPLVVLVHGGFFIGGNYHEFDGDAESLAKMGFIAASVGYRRCKRGDCLLAILTSIPCYVSWPYSFLPSAYVAAVDVNDGIRWLQEHAEDYFIDPEKVIVGGHSAGAITALNVAFLEQSEIQELISSAGSPGTDYLNEPLDPPAGIRAVIPMAGAMFDLDWIDAEELIERDIAVGIIHGTHDGIVAYDAQVAVPCCNTYQTVIYGGCSVAERVHELGGNLFMLTGEGFGHDVKEGVLGAALSEQIPAFIIKTVVCEEDISTHTVVQRDPPLGGCPAGTSNPSGICEALPVTAGITTPVQETGAIPAGAWSVSPSPLQGEMLHVSLNIPFPLDGYLMVRNGMGQEVFRQVIRAGAGQEQFSILFQAPPGTYYCTLVAEKMQFKTIGIIKI